jgi:hypothetical protein
LWPAVEINPPQDPLAGMSEGSEHSFKRRTQNYAQGGLRNGGSLAPNIQLEVEV